MTKADRTPNRSASASAARSPARASGRGRHRPGERARRRSAPPARCRAGRPRRACRRPAAPPLHAAAGRWRARATGSPGRARWRVRAGRAATPAASSCADRPIPDRLGQPHFARQRLGARAHVVGRRLDLQRERHRQVLDHRQRVEQHGALADDAEPIDGGEPVGAVGDRRRRPAEDADLALRRAASRRSRG